MIASELGCALRGPSAGPRGRASPTCRGFVTLRSRLNSRHARSKRGPPRARSLRLDPPSGERAAPLGRLPAQPRPRPDLTHIAEEIADWGKEQRKALRSWTVRILEHLILLEHSPASEPRRHWTREAIDFRAEVAARLTRAPRADVARRLPAMYDQARRRSRPSWSGSGKPGRPLGRRRAARTRCNRSSASGGQIERHQLHRTDSGGGGRGALERLIAQPNPASS